MQVLRVFWVRGKGEEVREAGCGRKRNQQECVLPEVYLESHPIGSSGTSVVPELVLPLGSLECQP